MSCAICDKEKLSEEYCPYNASDKCDHPCLICLRCMVNSVQDNGKCPYPECNCEIDKTSGTITLFSEILSQMFPVYEAKYTEKISSIEDDNQYVVVTTLTGEICRTLYSPDITVYDLQKEITKQLEHEPRKQKLLYNEKEITNGSSKLSDYGVEPNSTICLVVRLYDIPEDYDHVVFDLFWDYPMIEYESLWNKFFGGKSQKNKVDYLDASCLLFDGTTFFELIDYYWKAPSTGVWHSGDRMDHKNKKGHHTIDVHITKIPKNITHLFFTLSAWDSPSISKYPNPSLKFYENSSPEKNLCVTSFSEAGSSQAVVMCCMSKEYGRWKILRCGESSAGNAWNYKPLIDTITRLIKSGI